MNPRPAFALALALGVSVGVLWFAVELPRSADSRASPATGPRPTAPAAEASWDLDGVFEAPSDATTGDRLELQETGTRRVQALVSAADALGPGHLIFTAIDRETRRPVDSFTVRLASDTRFAEKRHDDPMRDVDLPLTPATYDALLLSPGYEPLELPPVRVVGGETVRLAPVELLPGSGSIEVEATGAGALDGLSVELRGFGRRGCACCLGRKRASPSPCISCGFEEDASSLRLGLDRRVRFTGLAHGPFRIRVADGSGRTIGDERGVDLGVGEAVTVLFDVSQSRTVEVELLDSDGVSLSTEWSRRLTSSQVEVEEDDLVSFEESDLRAIQFQMEIRRDGTGVAWAAFLPPLPPGRRSNSGTSIGCGGVGGRRSSRSTADRARSASDRLWPEPVAPHFEPKEVLCQIDPRGFAKLAPLSTSELEIHLTVGNFVAEAIVPPGPGPTHVRLRLRSDENGSRAGSTVPAISYRALELER